MPGVSRAGQDVAGSVIAAGSPDVRTNGSPTVRIGDFIVGHGKAPHSGPVMAAGSPDVFANNIPVCRSGDAASCGHPACASGNVLAN
jgi:uncharacterized Zn-binding protein involved in type VI secretion